MPTARSSEARRRGRRAGRTGGVNVRFARPCRWLLSILALLTAACNPTPPTATAPATGPTSAAPGKPAASAYLAPLPADKQVTIKFENYNLASAGLGRDATLEMIASFEAAHPNVKVETKATGSEEMFPSIQ